MEQDIVSLGYDPNFEAANKAVYDQLFQVYELLQKIDGMKLGAGGKQAGFGDLKTQAAALQRQIDTLTAANVKLTQSIKDGQVAQTKLTQTEKEALATKKQEQKITDDLSNTYKQYSLAAKDATLRAQNYYLTLGANSPITKQAAADALQMNNQLKLMDAQLGITNRNVGNYHGNLGTLAKTMKGLGGLGVIVSRALGIDPEVAMGIREAGRAIRDLKHIKEGESLVSKEQAVANTALTTTYNINTDATLTNAAATEADTVAIEEETVARTYLNTTMMLGIGGLALLAVGIYYLISTHKSHLEILKEEAAASKEYSDSIIAVTDALAEQNNILNKNLIAQKKRAEELLKEKQAAGTGLGTELAYKDEINKLDSKMYDNDRKNLPATKAMLDEQRAALQKLNDEHLKRVEITEKIAKMQEEGTKKVRVIRDGSDIELADETTRRGRGITRKIENVIKDRKELDDIDKASIESKKQVVEKLQAIVDKGDAIDDEATQIHLAKQKLAADEARKLALAEAQIRASTNADINRIILADDKSTFDQRIAAMRSNTASMKQLALDELNNVINDPTKNTAGSNDVAIARKQYYAKIADIDRDGAALIEKETEANAKRIETARNEMQRSDITTQMAYLSEITKNTAESLDKRLEAYTDFYGWEQAQIISDAEFKKKTQHMNAEELLAIETETKNKLKALEIKSANEISAIIVSSLNADLALQESYDKKELAYKIRSIAQTVKGKTDRDKQIKQATEDATRQEINDALLKDEKILNSDKTSDEEKVKAKIDINNKLADLYKLDADHFISEADRKKAKERELEDYIKQITEKLIELAQTLVDNTYQKQHDAIQSLIDANTAYQQAETDRIQNSTMGEADKAAKLIQLNESIAAKNQLLAERQKENDIKKAKFDKAAGIAKITIDTAEAVAATLPEGLVTGLTFLVAALGAVELAIAVATPIPTYSKGIQGAGHPGGSAVYGDVPEIVQEPGKAPYLADKTVMGILPRGTIITPLKAQAINEAMGGSMMASMAERLALVTAIENQSNDTQWKIAKYLAGELKPQKQRRQSPVIIQNKIDPRHAAWIGQQIYGR